MGKTTTVVLCFSQSIGGFLFGWEQSVISGLMTMPDFERRFGTLTDGSYSVSSRRQSLITGIFSAGCFVGALGSGFISSKIGIKRTNLIFLCLFIIGIAVEVSSKYNYGQIVGGRVLTGLAVGCLSGLIPTLQAELCPPDWRGVVTGSFQGFVTLGIFLCNIVNYCTNTYSGTASWRVPIGIQLAWGLIVLTAFALAPESPSYLSLHGKDDQCRNALARLRGVPASDESITLEITEIKDKQEKLDAMGKPSYLECFSTRDRIGFRSFIGIFLQISQQTTGVNFFFSYGVQFFKSSGITNSYVVQVILSAVNLICTFPGMFFVYYFGRRTVLLYGAAVMFIGQVISGAISTALPGQETSGKVLIAFSCIFIAGFAASFGPVVWVVCGETFPTRLAPRLVTVATGANWGMNTIIAFVVPFITGAISSRICFCWAVCIAISFVVILFFVPETKGLSIDQIDALYLSNTPAWRSSGFLDHQMNRDVEIKAGLGDSEAKKSRFGFSKKYERSLHHEGDRPVTDSGIATPATRPTSPAH